MSWYLLCKTLSRCYDEIAIRFGVFLVLLFIFIYWAALGLSCGHAGALVEACDLSVAECGF